MLWIQYLLILICINSILYFELMMKIYRAVLRNQARLTVRITTIQGVAAPKVIAMCGTPSAD